MPVSITDIVVNSEKMNLLGRYSLSFCVTNPYEEPISEVVASISIHKKDFDGVSGNGQGQNLGTISALLEGGASVRKEYTFSFNASIRSAFQRWQSECPDVQEIPLYLDISYIHSGSGVRTSVSVALVYRSNPPVISFFTLERASDGVASDEGESVLASMQIDLDDRLSLPVDDATLTLYYSVGDEVSEDSTAVDLTSLIPDALVGMTQTVIQGEFSNGSDWAFMLVFSDGYASVTAYGSLAKAFANVHLSGATTGGVAFGKFSASEEGAPLFECAYPAQMLGGIEGVNRYSTEEVLTGGVWIDGKPLYRKLLVYTSSIAGTYEDTDISDLNFEYIRIVSDVFCYKYGSNAYVYWAQGCWRNNDDDNHRMYIRDNTMRIADGAKVKRQAEYILLEYTKAD